MKIPNVEQAFVAQEKVVDYLLSEVHSEGKAIFFRRMGFSLEYWNVLAQALQTHAAECEVAKTVTSVHGVKYVVEGVFSTPDGRKPKLRSVWIVENGETVPRFVTAYPLEDVKP
jgi:hypothetical protein